MGRTLLILISMVVVSASLCMPYNTLTSVFANLVLNESAAPLVTSYVEAISRSSAVRSPKHCRWAFNGQRSV